MLRSGIVVLAIGLIGATAATSDFPVWNLQTSLVKVQHELGAPLPPHFIETTPDLIKRGEEIVKLGRTTGPNGKKSSYISKYYVCTTCHNLEIEDPDLSVSDPETRLTFAKEHQLPFLQGTTFKGIVNRESWYNDDYVKKYGDEKVGRAHNNLREAIQLCAIECSQGRPMEDWEIEAVLAYYWSLEYTLKDLGLSADDLQRLESERRDPDKREQLIAWLRSKYNTTSPAHFYDAPPSKKEGYQGLSGRPERGKLLYELSCLHCHQPGGVSHYILDDSKLSFRHLDKMIEKDSHFSLYQIIAYGTYAIPGHRPYMPHYPRERMNEQQVEDLRAYIELQAQ
jgi:mono/diheme cytochrome c family protein